MSAVRVPCSLGCGTWIDPEAFGVYQRVGGWAKNRAHGVNAIALREPQREWACRPCIDRKIAGVPDNQSRLW